MLMLFVFDLLLLLCIAKEWHLLKESWLLISSEKYIIHIFYCLIVYVFCDIFSLITILDYFND
jgi:hypothetical protein